MQQVDLQTYEHTYVTIYYTCHFPGFILGHSYMLLLYASLAAVLILHVDRKRNEPSSVFAGQIGVQISHLSGPLGKRPRFGATAFLRKSGT